MRDPDLSDYLVSVNKLVAEHYNDHTLESALQQAIWFNSTAFAGQPRQVFVPQPCTSQWHGMDSPTRYQGHLSDPVSLAVLAANGWLDQTINYTVNSWGFRSDREYDAVQEPCIVTLGCSFTYGTGLHEHQTWPRLLASRMGVGLVNLAVPGHGLDLNSLWLLLKGRGIANPVAVCVYEPPAGRISWLQHGYPHTADARGTMFAHTLLDICETDGNTSQIGWYRLISNLTLNSMSNSVKNFSAISSWAHSRGVPMVWCNSRHNTYTSLARDLSHWGWEWHSAKADWFFDQLNH